MSYQVGERVRLIDEVRTLGGDYYPIGSTGVVSDVPVKDITYVDMDNGQTIGVVSWKLETYIQVFASHYQAQPIMDEPAPATDDAGPTPDTPLSGEELMNITRSFCR